MCTFPYFYYLRKCEVFTLTLACETSPAVKSEEKRMFSQATLTQTCDLSAELTLSKNCDHFSPS